MAASRGLGYASALALAREGCDLVICSRDEARIRAAADSIASETGGRVQAVAADVSGEREASAARGQRPSRSTAASTSSSTTRADRRRASSSR